MPIFNTSDKTIRNALWIKLQKELPHNNDTAIISELALPYGTARVDIAVVNGVIHGYELKGDIDNLLRLSSQKEAYNHVFDKVTLVVGKKHLVDALHLIPDWWGITVAKSVPEDESPILIDIRKANQNPAQDLFMMVNLLWKNEAIDLMQTFVPAKNLRNKTKKVICHELIENFERDELKEMIKKQIIKRYFSSDWRVGEELRTYGD